MFQPDNNGVFGDGILLRRIDVIFVDHLCKKTQYLLNAFEET